MKKLFLGVLFGAFIGVGMSHAVGIESLTTAIDKQVEKRSSLKEQVSFLEQIQALVRTPKFKNSEYKDIFAELDRYSWEKIAKLQSTNTPSTQNSTNNGEEVQTLISDGTSHIQINNVDIQKVRDALLSWHNEERSSLGLSPLSYHSDLERTAGEWSDILRDEWRTSNTHERVKGDGYYNYTKLLGWFEERSIVYPVLWNGNISFSENVGYGYYKCSSSDCTNTLISSLKTTWTNLFMKEKSYNGAHYRALSLPQYTQMGIGVSIDSSKNRYYLVVHYSVDLLEKTAN